MAREQLPDDPLWYKDAVIYQTHVRAFYDSDGDGIGDFRGLVEKLDYLQELGVTAVWLLPFYPSPLRDDGYDIAEYTKVNPDYGTLADFRRFLREAHRRGLRVITELVVNHTSDQHPWFQRARKAKPGSKARDFYVWNHDTDLYREARIIFKDFETSNWEWDPVAQAYYWHRFYAHQPDLNFENPAVTRALRKVFDFWMGMGVDGMRLDAVPYLFERDGTNCENLPETHAWLRGLRAHLDARYRNRMLLAEANQWPEDSRAYFGDGDECHMAFHFPVMPRLFMAIRMEDRFPILDIMRQTPEIPANCQWAVFLRNHDELTLEMVTDEERDYMYRVYANDPRARINLGIRRRLAPLLGNDRRRIELMNGLLFSLPGTPIIYYGDEIGMGDNIYLGDRNGVRTPMQWSPDRNAGFSKATPQRLYFPVIIDPGYHYETVNVETQSANVHSLLWWMRRTIALRRRFQAFGRGSLEFLTPENHRVIVFLRRYRDECILVVANLSRFVQCVELDLRDFEGQVPVELFGQTRFPPIGELPYFLTLGPHAFYWFSLEPQETGPVEIDAWPTVETKRGWKETLTSERSPVLARALTGRRWFGGKARTVQGVSVGERLSLALPGAADGYELAFVTVDYVEGEADTYVVPLGYAEGEEAGRLLNGQPRAVMYRVSRDGEAGGVVYDAVQEAGFATGLLRAMARRRRFRGPDGELVARRTSAFGAVVGDDPDALEPAPLAAEQSNTSVLYGQRAIFKLFRRAERGLNPDYEVGLYLTERAAFPHTPRVAGALEYRRGRDEPVTLGILQEFVPGASDAWKFTLDALGRSLERSLEHPDAPQGSGASAAALLAAAEKEPAPEDYERVGSYLSAALLLGTRTGELHVALAAEREDPAFTPEPFGSLYQRSLYQSMRGHHGRVLRLLDKRLSALPEDARAGAARILELEAQALERIGGLLGPALPAQRIRVHGDYHLGQVLWTGKDFMIIDFEGEPARSVSERRLKRSPLQDVAGMLRSFSYASYAASRREEERGERRREEVEAWRRAWEGTVSAAFLRAYFAAVEGTALLPPEPERRALLLDAFLLDKAVYELGYELNNRPDWVSIPVQGLLRILETPVHR